MNIRPTTALLAALVAGVSSAALAEGMINTIVNSPLSATGTLSGTRVGINIYLQKPGAMGLEFMDPNVIGYGIPKGGVMEVEMGDGYERDWGIGISQSAIMMVTGAPQQGLPGKMVGYTVSEGGNENTFLITATGDEGLVAEKTMTPAPGAKGDPVRQRGIKVIHVGFQQSAFMNKGDSGTITVRIKDAGGKVVSSGTGKVDFIKSARAQILPNNFPQKNRNHNWQTVAPGGVTELPLTYMLYGKSTGTDAESNYAFKGGLNGVGVVAGRDGNFMDGLLVQDSNGDGKLDLKSDTVVGGINIEVPDGASGQALSSVMKDGKMMLSTDTAKIAAKPGKRWGGSLMFLSFKAGDKPGIYRATATLNEGSSYTYTIVAK